MLQTYNLPKALAETLALYDFLSPDHLQKLAPTLRKPSVYAGKTNPPPFTMRLSKRFVNRKTQFCSVFGDFSHDFPEFTGFSLDFRWLSGYDGDREENERYTYSVQQRYLEAKQRAPALLRLRQQWRVERVD
jgi:hypothetical protein